MSKLPNNNEKDSQHNLVFDEKDYTQESADRICTKYKGRIPILAWELGSGIVMNKRKFIVPKDITMGQFIYIIRKQITTISSSDGVYVFVTGKNTMIPVGQLMAITYEEHNENGFLRLTVTKENTFG